MMNMVARVISISGIFNFTIIKELKAPTNSAAAIAEKIATVVFCENQTNMEITIALDRDATDPTDKSKPLTVREMVMPIAIIVTIEMDLKILMTLLDWMNAGFARANTAINTKMVMMVPYLYKKSNSSKRKAGLAFSCTGMSVFITSSPC